MKLIDADKIIPWYSETYGVSTAVLSNLLFLQEIIKNMPAVDAKSHAHWEDIKGKEFCSACGKEKFDGLYADIYEYWDIPCCPHCGAVMDEII